jgi:regulator of cell morphogenesis and NO signaling
MSEIRQISNGFTAPKDACSSFKVLYSKLDEFEKNLQQHYHLENNILFPKVIKLEKELYR